VLVNQKQIHELEQEESDNIKVTIHSKKNDDVLLNNRMFTDDFLMASAKIEELGIEEYDENYWENSNDNDIDDADMTHKEVTNSPTKLRQSGQYNYFVHSELTGSLEIHSVDFVSKKYPNWEYIDNFLSGRSNL